MDADLADPFCLASDSVIRDQKGALWGLRMFPAHIGFNGIGSSGVELPEEVEELPKVVRGLNPWKEINRWK